MSPLEIAAAGLTLVCVVLTARQNIWCWPAGLAAVCLYALIFYEAKLYSDVLLQLVYIVLQLYGWWAWLYDGPEKAELPVTRLPAGHVVPWATICLLGTYSLGRAMSYTDASFPYVDAFAAVASLIAQWLMGRKQLESWLVWILVDVVSIGLYTAKQLYPTAILYAILLVLAVLGYFEWRKTLLTDHSDFKDGPASA
jgi:nicotinamide mononucleotide transporter